MGELITNLGIDWRLLIAQIANFIILLFILKRFLYKPLLSVIDKRAKVIEDNRILSEELKDKSKHLEEERQDILSEARTQAQSIIEDSYKKAKESADSVMQEARISAESMAAATQKRLKERESEFDKELMSKAGELITVSLEKVLPDVLDESTQERVVTNTLKELDSRN